MGKVWGMASVKIEDFIEEWHTSHLGNNSSMAWEITSRSEDIIFDIIPKLSDDFIINNGIAIHKTASVEENVVLKGPVIIGERCLIASGFYLRGGVYIANDCIIGPGSELKSSYMFSNSKIAHLNFVGDSVIGSNVNIEAGAIVANYRNEKKDKKIKIAFNGVILETNVEKFGALIGDGARVGANAVIAPGAIIKRAQIVNRLSLIDQYSD